MKRLISKGMYCIMAVALLSVMMLAGCNNKESTKVPVNGPNNTVTLKLAHQFAATSNGEGDYRSMLAEKFAEEVEERSNGSVKIEIYPADSLMKSGEQFNALEKGGLDMAIYLPFYDAGKVKDFSISLMPGIIKNSEQAWKWPGSKVGAEVEDLFQEHGLKMLVWTWAPATLATKGKSIIKTPNDVKGLKLRGAGSDSETMLQNHGAGIASMASSELYSALQTGVLDGTLTSYSSFMSYRLFEVVDNFLYLEGDAIMYALMPLVVSKDVYDNKLNEEQRTIIDEVSAELQDWVVKAVEQDNSEVKETFKNNGVNVYQISKEEADAWFEAGKPIADEFATTSERAKRMIEAAKELQ